MCTPRAPADAPGWPLGAAPSTAELPDVVEAWVLPASIHDAEARDRWIDPPQLPSHQGAMRGGLATQSANAWGAIERAPVLRHARASFGPTKDAPGGRGAEVYLLEPVDVDMVWASLQGRSVTPGPRLTLGTVRVDTLPPTCRRPSARTSASSSRGWSGSGGGTVCWLDPARTRFEATVPSGWHVERLGGWIALAREASDLDHVAPGNGAWWRDPDLSYWLHDASPEKAPQIGWAREVRMTSADGIRTFHVVGMDRHAL